MKKFLKISAISLFSLVAIIIVAFAILCFNIFSPSKLTKIVNNNASKFVTCDFNIDRAELTLFKTFPKIGIDLQNSYLINKKDTLLYAKNLTAALNIREFLKNNRIIIDEFILNDAFLNIIIDESGNPNYNIIRNNESDSSENFNYYVDLQKVKFDNVDVSYNDFQSNIFAKINGADLSLKGGFENENINGDIELNAPTINVSINNESQIELKTHNLEASFFGVLTDFKTIDGDLDIAAKQTDLSISEDKYLDSVNLAFAGKILADIEKFSLNLEKSAISIDENRLIISGDIQKDDKNDGFYINIDYKTEEWQIKEALSEIPPAIIGNSLDDIDIDGKIALKGKASGIYCDSLFPIITSDIVLQDADLAINALPYSFNDLNAELDLDLDLNNQTNLNIKSLSATTKKRNKFSASGTIKNLLGKMLCNILASGNLYIKDLYDILPSDFTKCDGRADISLKTNFAFDPKSEFSVDDIIVDADCNFTDFNILYHDTTSVSSQLLNLKFHFPVKENPYKIDEWINATASSPEIKIKNLTDFNATIQGLNLNAYSNNLLDSTLELKFATTFDISSLNVQYDTIKVNLSQPNGNFIMYDEDHLQLEYQGNNTTIALGNQINATSQNLHLNAKVAYNSKEQNPILQWSPDISIQLRNANAQLSDLPHSLILPNVNLSFNTKTCELKNVNARFGESDINLKGKIAGIESYIKNTSLLKGNLDLTANYLNLNQIIEVINGFNAPDTLIAQVEELETTNEDSPFIVPFGVDVTMKTNIKRALVEDVEFRNIGGQVYVKDGILVLEEMGLTNDAAKMQLTAIYKTPRLNHLFLGFDFHLLDIKIDKLIAMIPDVDTILPMLKAFSGNAEFHFAAETYLKSNYDIKYSTLRGAAAINGKDLVVLDNDTYKNISKKLLFNKNTPNKIDSLSTEITIYKNEVDVYPFSVSIDKYQAVISGRHNLDMTYDYNISLLKPVRIGLDIIGLSDKLKYKVGKAKYAQEFKPEKKKVVESNILELKTLINKSLRDNVKEQ